MTGAPTSRIVRLQREPIDLAAAEQFLADDTCGAMALFVGTVRDHNAGRAVAHMEYVAYDAMAQKQLEAIADDMAAKWDARRIVLIHRLGDLQLREASVLVAVSTPHRGDSFDACRFGIEEIKLRVPIWKREFTPDGAIWVDPGFPDTSKQD
jgi:molybdopterin synthase catalytic subunit